MIAWLLVAALCVLGLGPPADAQTGPPADAQTNERSRPFAWDVGRAVLIDPTTYVPAIILHRTMREDWKTSQVLFAHGWLETNPRFTRSGLPNDVPVSYDAGKQIIARQSLALLATSALHNGVVGIGERVLVERYPHRRKLIRTISWIERIGYASFISYRNAAGHVRQADENRRLAREFGYVR